MNGNWQQGKGNKLGNGRQEELYRQNLRSWGKMNRYQRKPSEQKCKLLSGKWYNFVKKEEKNEKFKVD